MQCYYCGKNARTHEHAPPRLLFKWSDYKPIVVPSCDKHNTDKTGLDRVIIRSLILSADLLPYKEKFPKEVLTLIEKSRPLFDEDYKRIMKGHVLNKGDSTDQDLSYMKIPRIEVDQWIKQMTAALVYKSVFRAIGSMPIINWDEATIQMPLVPNTTPDIPEGKFLASKKAYEELVTASEKLDWRLGWVNRLYANYPPSLYYLEVNVNNDSVIFRHTFLIFYNIFLKIRLPNDIRDIIIKSSIVYPEGEETSQSNDKD